MSKKSCGWCEENMKRHWEFEEACNVGGVDFCSPACSEIYGRRVRERQEELDRKTGEKFEAFATYQQALVDINDNSPSDGTTENQWEALQEALDDYILVVVRQDGESD